MRIQEEKGYRERFYCLRECVYCHEQNVSKNVNDKSALCEIVLVGLGGYKKNHKLGCTKKKIIN